MTSRLERIAQQRLEKLERIRARGINPYPHRYHRSHTTQQAIALLERKEAGLTRRNKASVAGRISARRLMGKSTFVDIRDGSGKIQLLFQDINRLDKETFKVRGQIIAAIRQFLNQRGFLEVETPVLQPSAGGALARPFTTHHHALDQDFYLRIALELHLKRLIIGGFDKVYELGRTFRNEGISTKHNPEFTMLESYEAYADYNDVMKMVETMVSKVSQQVLGTDQVKYGDSTIDFKPSWQRLELHEAVAEYSGIDFVQYPNADLLRAKMKEIGLEVDPQKSWARLVDELLSTFVEPKLIQPTFLMDYPVSMSPLAKTKPGYERVVERFEAFAGGMEIANAFTELNDPGEQRNRFRQQQKEKRERLEGPLSLEDGTEETIDEDFLLALEYGMPPTGGLGIGIDRLVMLLTNQQSIREVILFPQLREKA